MRHWMMSLLGRKPRELPLAKRDLLEHPHVDMLPTRWSSEAPTSPSAGHAEPEQGSYSQMVEKTGRTASA